MTTCNEKHHPNHAHKHGPNCGHKAVRHEGHVDYLHDGHLHHVHGDHVDEHVLAVSATNPVHCTPQTRCSHKHGPACGHETVPHGDHVDYLVRRPAASSARRPLRRPWVRAPGLAGANSCRGRFKIQPSPRPNDPRRIRFTCPPTSRPTNQRDSDANTAKNGVYACNHPTGTGARCPCL